MIPNKPLRSIRILILNPDEAKTSKIQLRLMDSELNLDIQHAKKEHEFIKKVLKFEPDVVIAACNIQGYSGIQVYNDVRLALPYAFFILSDAGHISTSMQEYTMSGIDCFISDENYQLLPVLVLQGFNKKHLEKIQHTLQQQLLERKMRMLAVFNNNPNAIFILGVKGEIIDLNPSGAKLLEMPGEKLPGNDFARFISKSDIKNFRSAFSSAFRGKITTHDFSFLISKRISKYITLNMVPIRDEERHITSLIVICRDVTELYLLRKDFKLNEERFLALANHAPVGIFYENADGKCLFVNKVWCELSGLSFKRSIGTGWTKAIHPEDRNRIIEFSDNCRKKNIPFVLEYRIVDSIGNIKWLRAMSSPYFCENNKIQGFIVTLSDITDGKLYALELEHAHTRQKISMQLAGLGFTERDLVNNTSIWSEEVCHLLEKNINEKVRVVGEMIETYVHPEDRQKLLPLVKEVLEADGIQQSAFRIITPSGKTKYLRSITILEKNLEGKNIKMVSAIQDITNDWKREELIKENEERLRYLFNHSPDAIYIEDMEGNILEANPEACRVQGLSKEELIGKNLADIAPPELQEEIFANYKKMAKQEIIGLKSYSWNVDGTRIPVLIKQRLIQYNARPALLLHVRKIEDFAGSK